MLHHLGLYHIKFDLWKRSENQFYHILHVSITFLLKIISKRLQYYIKQGSLKAQHKAAVELFYKSHLFENTLS